MSKISVTFIQTTFIKKKKYIRKLRWILAFSWDALIDAKYFPRVLNFLHLNGYLIKCKTLSDKWVVIKQDWNVTTEQKWAHYLRLEFGEVFLLFWKSKALWNIVYFRKQIVIFSYIRVILQVMYVIFYQKIAYFTKQKLNF